MKNLKKGNQGKDLNTTQKNEREQYYFDDKKIAFLVYWKLMNESAWYKGVEGDEDPFNNLHIEVPEIDASSVNRIDLDDISNINYNCSGILNDFLEEEAKKNNVLKDNVGLLETISRCSFLDFVLNKEYVILTFKPFNDDDYVALNCVEEGDKIFAVIDLKNYCTDEYDIFDDFIVLLKEDFENGMKELAKKIALRLVKVKNKKEKDENNEK